MLRDYQKASRSALFKHWKQDPRALVYLPTGGGKTELAIAIVKQAIERGHRVLVIMDRIVLINQWIERAKKYGLIDVGVLQGSNTKNLNATLVFAMAQTLSARCEQMGESFYKAFKVVVNDEAHIRRAGAEYAIDRIVENSGFAAGLSATPEAPGLDRVYSEIIAHTTTAKLTAQGHLVPVNVKVPSALYQSTNNALNEVDLSAGDYQSDQLLNVMSSQAIAGHNVKTWEQYCLGKKTITFCVTKDHAETVANQFTDAGVESRLITEDTPLKKRLEFIDEFEHGDVLNLVSVAILTTGFDAPIAEVCYLLRPTKSTSLLMQMVGRVMRPCAGKKTALVLDVAGACLDLGHPTDYQPPKSLNAVEEGDGEPVCKVCPQCESVIPAATKICGECGHEFEVNETADLVTVKTDKALPMVSLERVALEELTFKQILAMAKHVQMQKGYKQGWIYMHSTKIFKQVHGVEPRDPIYTSDVQKLVPLEPNEAFLKATRAIARAYAKSTSTRRVGGLNIVAKGTS